MFTTVLGRLFFLCILVVYGFFYSWFAFGPVTGGEIVRQAAIYAFFTYAISGLMLLFIPLVAYKNSKITWIISLVFVSTLPLPFAIDEYGHALYEKHHSKQQKLRP